MDTKTWTLDTAIVSVTVQKLDGSTESLDIPMHANLLGIEGGDCFIDLKLVPVWRRQADVDSVAVDPHTNEKRRIPAGTIMTYGDAPAMVDCVKPDELVKDEKGSA